MFKGFIDYLLGHLRQLHFDLKSSKHTFSWVLILSILAASVAGVQYTQLGLQTSVLTLEMPKDFDGTVYPLALTPKWHELTTAEYRETYNNIPQSKMQQMPRYNPSTLQASLSTLGYSDEENSVRDAKITYSVAYLGNYELDGVEYAGSHPAIDIKAPIGTPVHSIANGVVTKVADEAYGFGLHVVVKHINVPMVDGGKQTVFSSYNHMSEILVKQGQVVSRGEVVGKVGTTGTSTTPHLHFQLDKGGTNDGIGDSALWHPYWPFTYNDYASQGLTFFDAINQGIGQENAIKYTLNPMSFVQSNLVADTGVITSSVDQVITEDLVDEPVVTEPVVEPKVDDVVPDVITPEVPVVTEVPDVIAPEVPVITEVPDVIADNTVVPTKPNYSLEISSKDTYLVGNLMEFEISIKDNSGEIVEDPFFAGAIILSSTDSSIASLRTQTIDRSSFENGKTLIMAEAEKAGDFKLRIPFSDSIYESNLVTVRDDMKDINGFSVEHDGLFSVGVPETLTIIPVDKNGDRTSYTIFGEVKVTLVQGEGTISKNVLQIDDFSEGIAHMEVTPKAEKDIVVSVAHSFIKGTSAPLKSGAPLFSDLSQNHENYEAIRHLKQRNVISGYPDGTFKPEKGVSRVEALKLIFAGLEAVVPDAESLKFMLADLFPDQWYAPYVAHAINEGVVKGYPDGTFKPSQTVNKAEFAKMLVLGLAIDMDMTVAPDSPIIGSDVRPSDWFYPYVEFLIDNEIMELTDNRFNPTEPMDRGKVAEAIWRVIESQ
ncbi:MAG: S-layer homology domain-containing protein [Candidatus Peregrinibacteria bacterium]|nr:S-layer homology domain-containing protein [Candidatus Peregrinibacteria bacterium]MDZ4244735.1 S-layer homology domain-containing protein [Candidatus Gracilibacteria bacterium]